MIANAFFLALREIRNNLLRSILTTLGIIIGVGSVILLVTLGASVTKSVTNSIAALGNNTIVVFPGSRQGPPGDAPLFSIAMADSIRREIPHLAAVAPEAETVAQAVYGNNNHATQIVGSTNAVFPARSFELAKGRLFSVGDLHSGKAVCVIGSTIGKDLFGAADPVGARMRLNKLSCEVIGVLKAKGASLFGQDLDDIVFLPLATVQRRLTGNNYFNVILLSVEPNFALEKLEAQIEILMREKRHLAAGVQDDFTVTDQKEFVRQITQITGILTAFVSAVAAISLLVGGIGIMNIMLVSVTERTREIGIRLAIGALASDVLMQFLIEAVVMSGLGGIVGVALGVGGSALAAHFLDYPLVLQPAASIGAVVFSALVGVIFGYFPARRAARLDPIEALRHE